MKFRYLLPVLVILFLGSCTKEKVAPPPSGSASFTISCASTTVQGNYVAGVALGVTNTVILQVNVTKTGNFSVSTTTSSGIKFVAAGTFTSLGNQTVVLGGIGAPDNAGTFNFLVSGASNSCNFSVTVNTGGGSVITYVDNDHMLFGNPGNAEPLPGNSSNYLMRKPYYALSYSQARGISNWVSWHLFSGDLGGTPRQDDFRPDASLPAGWYQVPSNAYSGSGFDRGHSCPSGDRTVSVEANSSTFLMTNMIPQAPMMNQQTWAIMEDSLRRLVTLGNEIYIIMGSYGSGGTGTNGFATTIHGGLVTVPSTVWKVALVIPNGNNDSSRVDASARLIAVSIANSNLSTGSWKNYRTSVDAIEAATGYDLFDRLSVALQAVIEARVDNF